MKTGGRAIKQSLGRSEMGGPVWPSRGVTQPFPRRTARERQEPTARSRASGGRKEEPPPAIRWP